MHPGKKELSIWKTLTFPRGNSVLIPRLPTHATSMWGPPTFSSSSLSSSLCPQIECAIAAAPHRHHRRAPSPPPRATTAAPRATTRHPRCAPRHRRRAPSPSPRDIAVEGTTCGTPAAREPPPAPPRSPRHPCSAVVAPCRDPHHCFCCCQRQGPGRCCRGRPPGIHRCPPSPRPRGSILRIAHRGGRRHGIRCGGRRWAAGVAPRGGRRCSQRQTCLLQGGAALLQMSMSFATIARRALFANRRRCLATDGGGCCCYRRWPLLEPAMAASTVGVWLLL
jgi:hypothetical protein